MSWITPKPGDVILPSGQVHRTCENGGTMIIGTGNHQELHALFEEYHEAISAELEAMEIPEDFQSHGEWWD
jgi:hypothetical protein